MTEYYIRTYEERDYGAACAIFADGLREHIPAAFRHVLSRPQTQVLLLGVGVLAYVASASPGVSLGVASALLPLAWIQIKALSKEYIQGALDRDLRDIRGTYLEPQDCHFWVAENGEEVVGTVAVTHPEEPSLRGRALELKRMSVKKEHRGRGISKALTRTVLRFAQERGYREVVLGTSIVQTSAQHLYESVGFRRVRIVHPSLLLKLLQFHMYIYRFEILGSK